MKKHYWAVKSIMGCWLVESTTREEMGLPGIDWADYKRGRKVFRATRCVARKFLRYVNAATVAEATLVRIKRKR